jgi:UDPglucose--hexose-1-phosphate uridylyltransferase
MMAGKGMVQGSHRRYDPLMDEWVLVSPQRNTRPWQGQQETTASEDLPAHDSGCYLCPGNERAIGVRNPAYTGVHVFNNDFPAFLEGPPGEEEGSDGFFRWRPEPGINRVICYSDHHGRTLPQMEVPAITELVHAWQREFAELGALERINHVQIFENKGIVMGCSNPHPHGQIWAQHAVPSRVARKQANLRKYYDKNGRTLLEAYVEAEMAAGERIVLENEGFVALVPFWAVWPFETMVVSKRAVPDILGFTKEECSMFASILKELTIRYDNLFDTSFPYSAGMHQAPTDGRPHPEWHFHKQFLPPLLRSATVKKFMVGYEMLGEVQRDLTPEAAAERLRNMPPIHYKQRG